MSCAYFCNMKLLQTKTNLVFIPLLILAPVFIIVYLLLYWLVCIQLGNEFLKEDITHIWAPMVLSFAVVLIFIRPRVHLLQLDKDNGKIRALYYMVAAAVLCVPAAIGVNLLDTATGKMTQLGLISEIKSKPQSRYYKPSSYVLNKSDIGVYPQWSYSGKSNQYLDFDISIALPFGDHLFDTLVSPPAFLYFNYHHQVSSSLSDAEREKAWDGFWEESMEDFDKGKQGAFTYLEKMGNNEKRDRAIKAAQKSDRYFANNPITVLQPVYKPFEERNGNKPQSILISFFSGLAIWLIMILIPGLHTAKAKKFAQTSQHSPKEQIHRFVSTIVNNKELRLTHTLIAINVAAFLLLAIMGSGIIKADRDFLLKAGALYKPLVYEGQWWRLFTGIFLHGGIMHLAMNMISLYICGILTEPALGTKKMLLFYIASGVAASLASIWWHQTPVLAVGASGAIFGLYGFILAMAIFGTGDRAFNKSILILLACTAGFSLVMGFLSHGIDNAAHVGGLIAGFLMGMLLLLQQKKKAAQVADLY